MKAFMQVFKVTALASVATLYLVTAVVFYDFFQMANGWHHITGAFSRTFGGG